MAKIRTLLADDHPLFRQGLANILQAQPDFEVVGEARDGLEAIVKARELDPDLIIMDVNMPGADGVEATRRIRKHLPSATIVMLTVLDEAEKLFEAIKSGAQGYLLKTIRSRDLLNMLRGAVQGEAAISPALGGRMLEEFRRMAAGTREQPDREATTLTPRERQVLGLVAEGATDQQIAQKLTVSVYTVKSHMRNILGKLHLSQRHEAADYAVSEGLIARPEKPSE